MFLHVNQIPTFRWLFIKCAHNYTRTPRGPFTCFSNKSRIFGHTIEDTSFILQKFSRCIHFYDLPVAEYHYPVNIDSSITTFGVSNRSIYIWILNNHVKNIVAYRHIKPNNNLKVYGCNFHFPFVIPVIVHYSVESVSYSKDGTSSQLALYGVLNKGVGLKVHSCGSFIQDKNLLVPQQSSGQAKQLALPDAELEKRNASFT